MNFDHIPTAEILKDIEDTRHEILTMRREEALRAGARHSAIRAREDFILKLESILRERGIEVRETTG